MRKSSTAVLLVLWGCSASENVLDGPTDLGGTGGSSDIKSTGSAGGSGGSSGTATSAAGFGIASGGRAGSGGGASGAGGSGFSGTGGTVDRGTGATGIWEDVTPPGVTLDQSAFGGNNYGFMEALVDPVRPSDLYVFSCYQGVWRSIDFGLSWIKSSAPGSELDAGRQWAAAIDPDLNRDPKTPPSLYTTNGYGAPDGLFKSSDWGVTWTRRSNLGGIYSIDMDPYDNQHMLVGFHEAPGVAESTDGGSTWKQIATPDSGNSIYAFFIDTGSAKTTRTTWLAVPQDSSGGSSHRTTSSGASWSALSGAGHAHGSCQPFQTGTGEIFATLGPSGISKSTDFGVSWSLVSKTDDSAIVATQTMLYASIGPNYTTFPLKVQSAPRSPGTSWSMMMAPAAMKHGAKRMAVTNDGSHNVIIAGSWMSGIWRYVEP